MNYDSFEIKRMVKISSLKREKEKADMHFANFSECNLPLNTRKIVEAVSTSRHVDSGLVLLGWLASIAGIDRGCHRIKHKTTGYINSLALLIMGGAESGCGKSSALEPFIEPISQVELNNCNQDSSNFEEEDYDACNQRIKFLKSEYAKTGDPAKLDEIKDIKQKLNEIETKRNKPRFLTSDITKAAYFKLMVDQGFVMRMESDGILLPRDAFSMIRKFWGGETHSESRICRGQATCNDPFIVDLVFTQIESFTKFIKDKSYIKTGLCARMLTYRAAPHAPRMYQISQHELDPEIKELIRRILARVNDCATSNAGHQVITLDAEAEHAWDNFRKKCSEEASGRNAEIKEWAKRMAQHALRIAGVLHIAEYSEPEKVPVSWDEIVTAIQITEVLSDNLWECISGHANRQEKTCMCHVGIHILEENMDMFSATQIKQRFKDRYAAAEVDVALNKLEQRRIIRNISESYSRRRGRPAGHEYRNRYYDRRS
ncbi:DUF3987 domain-containing protein [Desulfovibrio sp.]|uniref:DUF3987 domain-containing protein n=1 Tax=Desulfovibrio sp. TaxID=885 RepID=UPI0025C06224|nr:DUF3987 domain-containing protein [Desulfovibrio sp.]